MVQLVGKHNIAPSNSVANQCIEISLCDERLKQLLMNAKVKLLIQTSRTTSKKSRAMGPCCGWAVLPPMFFRVFEDAEVHTHEGPSIVFVARS